MYICVESQIMLSIDIVITTKMSGPDVLSFIPKVLNIITMITVYIFNSFFDMSKKHFSSTHIFLDGFNL